MANVIVYIDGFNLYYGALKRTPYEWLGLDRLCSTMLPGDNRLAILAGFEGWVLGRPRASHHDPGGLGRGADRLAADRRGRLLALRDVRLDLGRVAQVVDQTF